MPPETEVAVRAQAGMRLMETTRRRLLALVRLWKGVMFSEASPMPSPGSGRMRGGRTRSPAGCCELSAPGLCGDALHSIQRFPEMLSP